MKRKKKTSQSEILRRKKQSQQDYQIYNYDKIFKEAERKRKNDLSKQYDELISQNNEMEE